MLRIYDGDIDGFGKDDWEDMLDNPLVPLEMTSDYMLWRRDCFATFRVREPDGFSFPSELWEKCPAREISVDLSCEGRRPEYSAELGDLLADIVGMGDVKRRLYRLDLYDNDFAEEMDNAADAFGEAYDRALARALCMLLSELHAARGE